MPRRRFRHLRLGERASIPSCSRASATTPTTSTSPCRWRFARGGDAHPGRVGNVLDANVNNATGRLRQRAERDGDRVQSNASAQSIAAAALGQQLLELRQRHGAGHAALHEQLRHHGRRRRPARRNRVALAEACDVACERAARRPGAPGAGRSAGWARSAPTASVGAVTYNAGGFAAGLDRALTESVRLGVTAGYSKARSGYRLRRAGHTPTPSMAVSMATTRQGPVYADALVGYAYARIRCGGRSSIPGAAAAHGAGPHRGQPVVRPARSRLPPQHRHQCQRLRHALRAAAAYTGTQNAFTETVAQSMNLTVAQQTTNSLRSVLGRAGRRRSISAGARSSRCSSSWAGATNMATSAARWRRRSPGAGVAVHDLRHLADARRRAAGLLGQHRSCRGDLDLPAL